MHALLKAISDLKGISASFMPATSNCSFVFSLSGATTESQTTQIILKLFISEINRLTVCESV